MTPAKSINSRNLNSQEVIFKLKALNIFLKMSATTFQCNYCENVFAKDRHLQKHLRKSHFRVFYNLDNPAGKEKTVQCSHCDETFRKQRHLEAHVSDVHGWLHQNVEEVTEVPENNEDPTGTIGESVPENEDFENDTRVAQNTEKKVSQATEEETKESPMLQDEPEIQNVDDGEDMDYTEETPVEESILCAEDDTESSEQSCTKMEEVEDNTVKNVIETETSISDSLDVLESKKELKESVTLEDVPESSEQTSIELEEIEIEDKVPSIANESDSSISEGLDLLKIKQEKPIILDDASFERLEEEVKKEQAKITEEKRRHSQTEGRISEIPSGRTSRRSTKTPVTYNEEDYDEKFEKKYLRESTRGLRCAKTEIFQGKISSKKENRGRPRRGTPTPTPPSERTSRRSTRTPEAPSGRISRRSTVTPVTYNEEDSDREFERKYLRESTKQTKSLQEERVQRKIESSKKENRGRPRRDTPTTPITISGRTSRRSIRTPISYNEESEDEDEVSRRRKKRRDSSSDFVIDGEAVTSEVEDDVFDIVEDEVLEVVEITPMIDEEEDYLPKTRKSKQGKRYECRLCYQVLYGELKMNLHMKLNHTKLKKRNGVAPEKHTLTESKVKEVRVMLKKVKQIKPKSLEPSFNCDFGKCKTSFKTRKERDLHKEDVHLYKCTKCIGTIIFETKSVFQAHMKKYHDLPCAECGVIFDNEELLGRHQASVHPHCAVCEDEFSWPSPGHSCPLTRRRKK